MEEGKHGLVVTMTRTYRDYKAAVRAGLRRAHSTGTLAFVGMQMDCKFHISDDEPETDFRYDSWTVCSPTGRTWLGRR
ncbi:MAG TPA: hypothetical protein VIG47_14030 [Gemmatimonadaceae bacterium]|jgi:hypothetical protein